MATIQAYELDFRTTASPAQFWAKLVDGARWSEWTFIPKSMLEAEGVPAPDGVGAIRKFGVPPRMNREQVTIYETPTRFGYKALSGLPVVSYSATVELTPDGNGTKIHWVGEFEPKPIAPPWIMKPLLKMTVKKLAAGLIRAAERDAG